LAHAALPPRDEGRALRESGESRSGGAKITLAAHRSHGWKGRPGRVGGFDWIDRFLALLREPRKEPAPEQRISTPKPSDFVGQDFGKLGGEWTSPNSTLANFHNTLLNGGLNLERHFRIYKARLPTH
jgi:hypothetical protein